MVKGNGVLTGWGGGGERGDHAHLRMLAVVAVRVVEVSPEVERLGAAQAPLAAPEEERDCSEDGGSDTADDPTNDGPDVRAGR